MARNMRKMSRSSSKSDSRSNTSRFQFQNTSGSSFPLLLLPFLLILLVDPCQSFSTPSPNNNNNNNSSGNSSKKHQSSAQQIRHEENLRRLSRVNDNKPGQTSAIPGEKDLPLNPAQTQAEWYNQASQDERKVKELTSKGMEYLRGLQIEKARDAFEHVYQVKPYTYCWQYGIVLFYLGEYYSAAECFAKNAKIYESKFGIIASEERIWRDACELKIVHASEITKKKLKDQLQKQQIDDNNDGNGDNNENDDTIDMKVVKIKKTLDDPILGQLKETRKVMRIVSDLFSSSIDHDLSNEALARGKLRSICGEYENANKNNGIKAALMTADKKMWRLSSWFYLGLHYDVLDDVDASKECMKMALRQCGSTFGNGDDIIQTLPMLHMARRDWFDDDQFLEDDGDFEGFDEHNHNQEDDEGGITATKSTMNENNNLNDELFQSIRDSVGKMKLKELKISLKKKGLKSSGSKSVLKDRLLRSLLEEVGLN